MELKTRSVVISHTALDAGFARGSTLQTGSFPFLLFDDGRLTHAVSYSKRSMYITVRAPFLLTPQFVFTMTRYLPFLQFTRMMWGCSFSHAESADGAEIPVDINAYSEGFSSHPLAFECDIVSRGEWVSEVIEQVEAK